MSELRCIRVMTLVVTLLSYMLVDKKWAMKKVQSVNGRVRYFSPIAPPMLMTFTAGGGAL